MTKILTNHGRTLEIGPQPLKIGVYIPKGFEIITVGGGDNSHQPDNSPTPH